MKFYGVLALVFLSALALAEEKKDYTNYKFIQVFPNTEAEGLMLADWEINNIDFDVWSSVKKDTLMFDVMLSPEAFVKYTTLFNQLSIPFIVLHENVQQEVDREAREMQASRMEGRIVGTYATLADIHKWLDDTATNNSFVSTYSAGKSDGGNDLKVLVINPVNPGKRIWFDCGIHAREWISPATCVSLIDKFVNDYKNSDANVVAILNKFEIHFLPVLNPDGYEYTFATNGDRFWRKNRKRNQGSTCVGVDLNRNFPFQWFTGGSSNNPCSDTHAGPTKASEPETQALINAVTQNPNGNFSAYYTIHSYGNWFLTSYGHTYALPPDYAAMKKAGDLFAAAVYNVDKQNFTVGSTANLLYIASGASSDWAYGDVGLVNSATIELRPKNGFGLSGFDLPKSQISIVGTEIYAGVQALINNIP